MQASVVRVMLNVGVRKPIRELTKTMRTSEEAWQVSSKAKSTVERATHVLRDFDLKVARRLELALSLLYWEGMEKQLQGTAELRGEIERIMPVLGILQGMHAALCDLRTQNAVLSALINCLQNGIENERLMNDLDSRARQVSRDLRSTVDRLGTTAYPFEHASGEVSVVRFALPDGLPTPDDLGASVGAADELTDALFALYGRGDCAVGGNCRRG